VSVVEKYVNLFKHHGKSIILKFITYHSYPFTSQINPMGSSFVMNFSFGTKLFLFSPSNPNGTHLCLPLEFKRCFGSPRANHNS